MIPNNKIKFKQLNPQAIHEARRIASELNGLAKPAYELIEYDR